MPSFVSDIHTRCKLNSRACMTLHASDLGLIWVFACIVSCYGGGGGQSIGETLGVQLADLVAGGGGSRALENPWESKLLT